MSTRKLTQLRREMKGAGVTQKMVADAIGRDPSHVSHVLAGRFTSRKVIQTAERLIAEAAPARRRLQGVAAHA